MRLRLAVRIALALSTLLVSGRVANAQGFATFSQFSNWLNDIQTEAQRQSERYEETFIITNVCVEDHWVQVAVFTPVVGDADDVETIVDDLPLPCDPSVDQNGAPLDWTDNLKMLAYALDPLSLPDNYKSVPLPSSPHAAQANTFMHLAPYRDVPFPPLYSSTVPLSPVTCDPSRNANALIVNHTASAVTRVDACTGTVLATISVTSNPLQVAQTPDASTALVTSFDGALTFIDLNTNQVAYKLDLSQYFPSGLAISSDGSLAYVTSFDDVTAALLVIDIAKRSIVQTVPLTGYPQSVFLTPNGSLQLLHNGSDRQQCDRDGCSVHDDQPAVLPSAAHWPRIQRPGNPGYRYNHIWCRGHGYGHLQADQQYHRGFWARKYCVCTG